MLKIAPILVAFVGMVAYPGIAQTAQQSGDPSKPQDNAQTSTQTKPAAEPQAEQQNKPTESPSEAKKTPVDAKPNASARVSVNATKIPSGSRIYVAPMGGFENYVIAGILKKKVPVTIVSDRDKAEYEIRGAAETEKAGWAKMLFMGSQNTNEQASINVQEIKSGSVVFAYSVNKLNSVRGKQSAGEAIGKHLNEAIGKD
jgi:cytoskeletal protein RodZ